MEFEPVPFSYRDFYKIWILREHNGTFYIIPDDLAARGMWGNCRRSYTDKAIATAAFNDFLTRLAKMCGDYEKAERDNVDHGEETVKLIRNLISAIGSIQETSDGYLRSQSLICRSRMKMIKHDADIARSTIRMLAQHIGVEY